eukprot:691243-Karenia_brevis.AAC.1
MPGRHRVPVTERVVKMLFFVSLELAFSGIRNAVWYFVFAVLIRVGFMVCCDLGSCVRPGEKMLAS